MHRYHRPLLVALSCLLGLAPSLVSAQEAPPSGARAEPPGETPTPAPTAAAAPAAPSASATLPPPQTSDASERRTLPSRLGPVAITMPNGELSIGFAAQFRATTSNDGSRLGAGGPRANETTLDLRRVRLFLRGTFLDGRLSLLTQLSTAPSSLELLDLAIDGRLHDHASLRVGVFKTPFTLHRFRSFQNLTMTEWDPASVRFGAERQYGMEVHSNPSAEAYIDYSLGVFSGMNARASFARGIAETYDEPLPNPSNLRTQGPPTTVHPEIIGRIGYASAGAEPLVLSDARGGAPRGYAALSFAYDARPVETQDFAVRIAAEGMLKAYGLTVNAVGYLGFHDSVGTSIGLGMVGATLDATYRVLPHFELAARYSRVDTLVRLRTQAGAYLDRQLALADPAEALAIFEAHDALGTLRHQEEIALGINVPIAGRSLVLQSDFAILRFDRVGTTNDTDGLRWRTQLQFAF